MAAVAAAHMICEHHVPSNSITSESIIRGSSHPHTPAPHADSLLRPAAHRPSQPRAQATITTPGTGHRSCSSCCHSKQLVCSSDQEVRPGQQPHAVLQQLPSPCADVLLHNPDQADNCSCSCWPAGCLQALQAALCKRRATPVLGSRTPVYCL